MNPSLRILSSAFVCLVTASLLAQGAPEPPTPYPSPITGYVGRYLDSTQTPSYQYTGPTRPRTYRADLVKADAQRDMLYMIVGSTLVGQTLSTFADRVATEPVAEISRPVGGEQYLPFEKWVDADRSPGWVTFLQDSQDRLYDFDFDDRGYLYLAYSLYGFGIIDEDFQRVAQLTMPALEFLPEAVVSFRSGASYYALVSDADLETALYDVTTPAAPVRIPAGGLARGFSDAAKTEDGRIAFVMSNGELQIHTPATILANGSPIYTSPGPGPFHSVATDGTNFYALGRNGLDIHVLQPSGDSFAHTITPLPDPSPDSYRLLEYGAGYLTVGGAARRIAIYRVEGTSLTLLENGQYYFDWIADLLPEHAYVQPRSPLPVFDGTQTLLIAATFGLGDVYTMTDPPALTVTAQFSPATILPSGTTLLTLAIANPNAVPVSFSLENDLPANVLSTGAELGTTCGLGVVTSPVDSTSFTLTNASVAASSSCTVTLEVTSNVPGDHTIEIPAFAITSADNSNSASAEAALVVEPLDAPEVTKAFAPSTATVGVPVRMTITLTNPNTLPITGVAFSDDYPAGLINATPVDALNTCGGVLSAATGGASLSLSGATIPASQSCTVAVDVTLIQPGSVTNTIPAGAVTSSNAEPSDAAATAVLAAAAYEAVPTLTEWTLLLMALVLGTAALLRMRT